MKNVWILVVLGLGCSGNEKGSSEAPRIIQVLSGLDNPESVAFSADGKWLFVTNCASGEFGADQHGGFVSGQASVSKLSVAADGTLAIVKAKFATGLTAALGVTVSTKPFGPYPAGSVFACVGGALAVHDDGSYVNDAKELGTGVVILDPETGGALGKIDLGVGSAIAVALGHPLLLPNGIAFDHEGALLVADSGFGGEHLKPAIRAQPGLLRITLTAKGDVSGHTFTPVSGGPNGVAWNETEKAAYWVTCGGKTPEGGALYRNGRPVALGIGESDGLCFTPAGTVIVSRFKGDLVAIRNGAATPIPFEKPFNFPSDIKLRTLADGSSIVVVPEQEAWNAAPWGQSLKVIRLPAGF